MAHVLERRQVVLQGALRKSSKRMEASSVLREALFSAHSDRADKYHRATMNEIAETEVIHLQKKRHETAQELSRSSHYFAEWIARSRQRGQSLKQLLQRCIKKKGLAIARTKRDYTCLQIIHDILLYEKAQSSTMKESELSRGKGLNDHRGSQEEHRPRDKVAQSEVHRNMMTQTIQWLTSIQEEVLDTSCIFRSDVNGDINARSRGNNRERRSQPSGNEGRHHHQWRRPEEAIMGRRQFSAIKTSTFALRKTSEGSSNNRLPHSARKCSPRCSSREDGNPTRLRGRVGPHEDAADHPDALSILVYLSKDPPQQQIVADAIQYVSSLPLEEMESSLPHLSREIAKAVEVLGTQEMRRRQRAVKATETRLQVRSHPPAVKTIIASQCIVDSNLIIGSPIS